MSATETGGRGGAALRRPVATVAALYGAGGGMIGPRVAERLGAEFLDRAIPASVARQTGVPEAGCAFDLDACADFIVTASRLLMEQARS